MKICDWGLGFNCSVNQLACLLLCTYELEKCGHDEDWDAVQPETYNRLLDIAAKLETVFKHHLFKGTFSATQSGLLDCMPAVPVHE